MPFVRKTRNYFQTLSLSTYLRKWRYIPIPRRAGSPSAAIAVPFGILPLRTLTHPCASQEARERLPCRDAPMPRAQGCARAAAVQGCTNAASAGMRKSGHRRVLKNEFFITLLTADRHLPLKGEKIIIAKLRNFLQYLRHPRF